MIKYFDQFVDAGTGDLDVLILDEAHRNRDTWVDRSTERRCVPVVGK